MKYVVSWDRMEALEGREAEVDAESRWEAVVAAATQLNLEGVAPMQQLFNCASVRKAGGPKKVREWRFKELEKALREAEKDLEKDLEEKEA